MALFGRAYDRALCGALAGLVAWLWFGALGNADDDTAGQQLLAGALIGGALGFGIASGPAWRERLWPRAARCAVYGIVSGVAGGALGFWLADRLESGGGTLVGWLILGAAVGAAEGVAARGVWLSLRGLCGGVLAGLMSGTLVIVLFPDYPDAEPWRQPLALVVAGGCIGTGVGLAREILRPATLAVVHGPGVGTEYALLESRHWLGRDPHGTVPLSDDPQLEPRRALIERQGDRFILTSDAARLNGAPLTGPRDLTNGDRIRLGNLELRFEARLARTRRAHEAEPPGLDAVANHPLDEAPFEGITTVRALAARMQAGPQAAAALLENGTVARWFARNGWGYPVRAAMAPGLAAVQQFFEALSLAKPPAVTVAAAVAEFECIYPERLLCTAVLQSATRKWVFAEVASAVPWLKVVTPHVSGAGNATVEYELDSSLLRAGRHEGQLHLAANAGQQLTFTVRVTVHRPQEPFTRRLLRPLLKGAMAGLLARLLLAAPGDVAGRLVQAPSEQTMTLAFWTTSPLMDPSFIRHFIVASWWWGLLAPLLVVRRLGWIDLLWCIIAGGAAGLALSATAACLLPVVDAPPRELWRAVAAAGNFAPSWLWLPLWLLSAAFWWATLGAVLNLLARVGAHRR